MINPMDWILNRTVEQTPLGVSIAEESFTDLDFADDVSLLAEMLEILVAGLLVLQDEAAPLGLRINWSKTDPACRGTSSDPAVGPGGSRERQLGRVYLPWLADLTRRGK